MEVVRLAVVRVVVDVLRCVVVARVALAVVRDDESPVDACPFVRVVVVVVRVVVVLLGVAVVRVVVVVLVVLGAAAARTGPATCGCHAGACQPHRPPANVQRGAVHA